MFRQPRENLVQLLRCVACAEYNVLTSADQPVSDCETKTIDGGPGDTRILYSAVYFQDPYYLSESRLATDQRSSGYSHCLLIVPRRTEHSKVQAERVNPECESLVFPAARAEGKWRQG